MKCYAHDIWNMKLVNLTKIVGTINIVITIFKKSHSYLFFLHSLFYFLVSDLQYMIILLSINSCENSPETNKIMSGNIFSIY